MLTHYTNNIVVNQGASAIRTLFFMLVVVGLVGCVYLQPAQRPMAFRASLDQGATNLLILLPGMGDSVERFYQNQFPQMLQQKHAHWDVLVLNAHFGYYRERRLIDAFKQDILPTIKAKPYQKVIVGGISLGGFGSLLIQHEFRTEIDGIVMMAAYLGDEEDLAFAMQQPIARWPQRAADVKEQQLLVSWYQSYRDQSLIGFGEQDRFAEANSWLSQDCPKLNIYRIPGNHKWPTWQKLWQQMLEHPSFWQ